MGTRRNRIQAMLDDEEFDTLVEKAEKEGETVSNYVRLIIREKLGL